MSFLNPYAANLGGGSDPSFSSVVMLCHFNGTNASQVFVNECPRGTGFTFQSTISLSTAQKLFGSASLQGAGGDISSASHADYNLGAGDWTIEFAWYTTNTITNAYSLFDMRTSANSVFPYIFVNAGVFWYKVNGVDQITGGTVVQNVWQRIAVSKVSGTTRMFKDGTQIGSNYTDGNNYAQTGITVGGDNFATTNEFRDYIDEVRVTNGVGRYAANYTVATAAFPNF